MIIERTLIAVGGAADGNIWPGHFGIAPVFYLYNQQGVLVEKRPNPYGAGQTGMPSHHDNPRLIVDLLPESGVFIARRMGGASKQMLVHNLNITTVLTAEKQPDVAVRHYLRERGRKC